MRWPLFVVVLAAASCSAPGPSNVEPATAGTLSTGTLSTGTLSTGAVVDSTSPTADDPAVTGATSTPDAIASVKVDLRLGDVSTTLVGDSDDASDPFGDFVSCSGLRSAFSTYSVLVSTTVGPVRAISAITTATVAAEGIYDAAVRVERDDGSALDATGTITLLPGLRTGSFFAFDSLGASVEGSFECLGGPAPSPIDVGTAGVGAVEVFALLRQGDSERIVGLTATTDSLDEFRCSDEIVARGDESIGAITEFRLSDNSLELMVGQVRSVFDEITLGDSNDDTAGSFSGAGPEMSVDGAYRCS